ncbi:MAG: 6-phosphogluconolactonase [Spirochaetia bacterium]|jgi:6-phosphogluconolactonase
MMEVQTLVAEDPGALAELASGFLLAAISEALFARGSARVILAGGETPRLTYSLLAAGISERRIPLSALSWYLGDERWVPRDDPQSNEGMARAALLSKIGAPEESIRGWKAANGTPVDCAREYADEITRGMNGSAPDLLILGLGADGHTASLFPGSTAWLPGGEQVTVGHDMPGTAAAVEAGAGKGWRLSLCPRFLRTSRSVVFLVAGADKSPALRRVLAADPATPGAWIRGESTCYIVTRDAAGPERPQYGQEIRHA